MENRSYVCFGLVILCSIIVTAKGAGCEQYKTGRCGDPWGRPLSSSGRLLAEMMIEKCDNCIAAGNCRTYGNLNDEEQIKWQERFSCQSNSKDSSSIGSAGSAATDKGDIIVCCPENVWGVEDASQATNEDEKDKKDKNPNLNNRGSFGYQPNDQNYNNDQNLNSYENSESDESGGDEVDANTDYEASRNRHGHRPRQRPNVRNPYFLPANGYRNVNGNGNGNSRNYGNGNTLDYRGTNSRRQCSATSSPPEPSSGCCGLEASENDRINTSPNAPYNPYQNSGRNNWMPQMNLPSPGRWPNWMSQPEYKRKKRDDNVSVTIDNRIAGGKETDLAQFPWTALLKTTFVYPTKEASFSCGGSLISSRYVLTAGHCVFDSNGNIKGIEVTLAEYDKRTFPQDCKMVLGRGEICVENIVIQAENYALHPEYDDSRLYNDIALVRLQGFAPYTDYIRPICLPPIDIDSPELSNLRLAVAGWGRNGAARSNTKQSTIVNLVPQEECKSSYPNLARGQVCAAGYNGEDTCKGDSGGPLMIFYNGKYYVSGVVSGKRSDAPCGTSVPSLYTNVYHYVPWIRSVIRD